MVFFFRKGMRMLLKQIDEIRERIERTGIGLKDALSVIDMTFEDQIKRFKVSSPYEAFSNLNQLINETAHGAKIERFRPEDDKHPFHTFEIHTEEGEILGYLNMIYLKRSIPCYYLVYVEVLHHFRGLGLGYKILKAFMEFVNDKKAVGLLDNIIPPEEPTYETYTNLGWKTVKDLLGNGGIESWGNYMAFVPESIQTDHINKELIRILYNLRKKRPVIDMHDNEDMVKRTIEEFRSVYQTLVQLFNAELSTGTSTPLMRFMLTRLTTKWIGFRRQITSLIGYTGGESLEQVSFSDQIMKLPIQPCSLWGLKEDHVEVWGDQDVLQNLPKRLKEEPTFFIESLPFYKRPYLHAWMERIKTHPSQPLKISDLLDLGFDPTRLRYFHHEGMDFIFERISPHLFPSLLEKRKLLRKIEKSVSEFRPYGALIRINPLLLVFRDRGNLYALRKKVEGIHSQEALDQLRTSPHLSEMNRTVEIDRIITRVIHEIKNWLRANSNPRVHQEIEDLTYFFPWDIEKNFPRICVDISSISIDTIWIT
jgi:GNAT superfamily N-acetyltransferase